MNGPDSGTPERIYSSSATPGKFTKICAKFSSGVRFGVGFVLERTCGVECNKCTGAAFERECRIFNFRPHFDVKLEQKVKQILAKVSSFI